MFPASAIRESYELGVRDFGENYLQEFEGKYPEVRDLAAQSLHAAREAGALLGEITTQVSAVSGQMERGRMADGANDHKKLDQQIRSTTIETGQE